RSAGEAWAYDGTGIIQIYAGAASSLEVGKVYTIAGTIDWYFGIWEITNSTADEQPGATPQFPDQETITSVDDKLEELIDAGEHLSASLTAEAGNFEPIYATVTGRVYMIPGDTTQYNTYLVDVDYDTEQEWVPGNADLPG